MGAQGIVEGGVSTVARVEEKAVIAAGVRVSPDDLTCGIDAAGCGAIGGRGIVEGCVKSAAEKEAVIAAGVAVSPDDLAQGVDAAYIGAIGGQGSVEGCVGAAA